MRKSNRSKGKKVVQSKKVKIDGIQFQSRLESTMYLLLKEAGIKNMYEGQSYQTFKPFLLQEECWERATKKSKSMIDRRKVTKVSYTPDFIGENDEWFIEVKGRANESFSIRWKLFKELVSKMDKPPLIFKPTNVKDCEQVIEILKSKGYGTT